MLKDASGSSVANNINLLWYRYNINKFNFQLQKQKCGILQETPTPEEDSVRMARTIKDFCIITGLSTKF